MHLLRAVSRQYCLTHGRRLTRTRTRTKRGRLGRPDGGWGVQVVAAESSMSNADASGVGLLGADPIEVSVFTRARTGTGPSRRCRTAFDGSSGRYCHHAHLAQARTGRRGYGIDKEPKSGLFWSTLRPFRIWPSGSSSEMAERSVPSTPSSSLTSNRCNTMPSVILRC